MKDKLNRRQPQWKTTSMEDNLNGRRHQGKPYRKMSLACLVNDWTTNQYKQAGAELGQAQNKIDLLGKLMLSSSIKVVFH